MRPPIIDVILDQMRTEFRHEGPIFEDPPVTLDESSTHGALVGGLVWTIQPLDVAQAYRHAAEFLIDASVQNQEAWGVAYPILFLYRHAIELTLKALIPDTPPIHALPGLIEQADIIARGILQPSEADWMKARLTEFAMIDPRSTAFRFAYAGGRSGGEWWVDFFHLKQTMDIVLRLLEAMR